MTKLWPIEEFRKFKIQPEIQIQPQTDWAGKFPAQPQVEWGVDLPQLVSTAQSTPLSTWVVGPVWPGAPVLAPGSCFVGL